MTKQTHDGTLYIVATPIGNYEDITLRGLKILKEVHGVICEEIRQGSTLLKKLGITGKPFIELNEHNEKEQTPFVIQKLIHGENLALISDCGTPVFADPGATLIHAAHAADIRVVPIPGVSSLMTALSILDESFDQFYFSGFLPRESTERIQKLVTMKSMQIPIILMDTPYRLQKVLQEIRDTFGPEKKLTLACDLTLPSEWIETASCADIMKNLPGKKAEFILIIHPSEHHASK